MEYRYLETTGALNVPGPEAGWRGRRDGSAWKDRERGGGKPPVWRGKPVARALCDLVPESLARGRVVFPVGEQGETLILASVEPNDIALRDKLTFVLGRPVLLIAASREEVMGLIRDHFGDADRAGPVDSLLQSFTDGEEHASAAMARGRRAHPPRPIASLEESAPRSWDATDPRTAPTPPRRGIDPTHTIGDTGVWFYVVEEGQRVLVRNPDGSLRWQPPNSP